jgi:hypothetical protein
VSQQQPGGGNGSLSPETVNLRLRRPGWAAWPGAGPGGPGVPLLRATDRDREAVTDALREAYATGRLSSEEHGARLGAAMSARSYAELDPLTADLPHRPVYPDAPPPPRGPRRTNGLAVAALVCGLLQPLTCMLSTIPAIVLGHRARRQIRQNGEDGLSLANWGLILGWGGLTAMVAFVLLFIAGAVLLARSV